MSALWTVTFSTNILCSQWALLGGVQVGCLRQLKAPAKGTNLELPSAAWEEMWHKMPTGLRSMFKHSQGGPGKGQHPNRKPMARASPKSYKRRGGPGKGQHPNHMPRQGQAQSLISAGGAQARASTHIKGTGGARQQPPRHQHLDCSNRYSCLTAKRSVWRAKQ